MDLLDSPIYYVVMAAALLAVLLAICRALDPNAQMSRFNRMSRLIAGPLFAVAILCAMILRIWEQAGQR